MAGAGASAPLFQLDHFTLRRQGRTLLEEISLSVHAGERIAFLGESGAGKSTLLRQLWQQRPQSVAYCPQEGGLVEMLSAFHNIYMGGLDRHSLAANLRELIWPSAARLAEIGALAEALDLAPQLRRSVDRLSGGQRQRTALGRALYRRQPIFVGDEPVSALDPFQGDRMLRLINERHETTLVALHDRRLALAHFDRILVLAGGRIVLDAPAAELSLAQLDRLFRA